MDKILMLHSMVFSPCVICRTLLLLYYSGNYWGNNMKNNMKSVAEWKKLVEEFQRPHIGRGLFGNAPTPLGPILGIWIALYHIQPISWLTSIALAAVSGLFLVRAFIIFHDCGHGSFFKTRKQMMPWVFLRACSPSPPTTTGNGNMLCTMPPMAT